MKSCTIKIRSEVIGQMEVVTIKSSSFCSYQFNNYSVLLSEALKLLEASENISFKILFLRKYLKLVKISGAFFLLSHLLIDEPFVILKVDKPKIPFLMNEPQLLIQNTFSKKLGLHFSKQSLSL